MGRSEAYRRVADHPAVHGTYPDVGEKADGPERYAGEVGPTDIIERAVEGLPPDRAHGLGQVPGYRLRAGRRDDIDVEPGRADSCAHRSVSGHRRGRWRHTL